LINVRTDLDRFTPDEVTALIAHGYSKAREALLDKNLIVPDAPRFTWDPLGNWEAVKKLPANHFQRSRLRKWRLWSLTDPISWITGLYALFICLLLATPTLLFALQSSIQAQIAAEATAATAKADAERATAHAQRAAAQTQVLSVIISQIQNLMVSMSQGCSGGASGVPPVNWQAKQQPGNAAVNALNEAKLALARGQTSDVVRQINSAKDALDALVNGLQRSCSGGASGENPVSYNAYLSVRNTLKGNLDELMRSLGGE
jgi:uncharacterized protein YukE